MNVVFLFACFAFVFESATLLALLLDSYCRGV